MSRFIAHYECYDYSECVDVPAETMEEAIAFIKEEMNEGISCPT